MDTSNMKNIVVLKEVPSNIVEEAIVILKANVNMKNIEKKRDNVKVAVGTCKKTKDYIVKEAESVVADYLSSIEQPKKLEITNRELKKKYEKLKRLTICFAIVAVFGIIVNLI